MRAPTRVPVAYIYFVHFFYSPLKYSTDMKSIHPENACMHAMHYGLFNIYNKIHNHID